MKCSRVGLTVVGKTLAEVKIQRGILETDALSPLLFVMAMMPLNRILRKCTESFKFSNSQGKNQTPNVYRGHQAVCKKNEKELETIIQAIRYSQNIGMEFCLEKCAMLIKRSDKRPTRKGIKLRDQERIRTLREKDIYFTKEFWKQTPSNKWR